MFKKLLFLVFCTLILVSCYSDGEAWIKIAYQTLEGTEYININDNSHKNGVFVDRENVQLYCQFGPDHIITLPAEAWSDNEDSALIEIDVKAVCLMGQVKLNAILENFTLEQQVE